MTEKLLKNNPGTLIINEIFHSIQGESSHVGRACVFVRLTYCNIRCSYCDTPYAFEEGQEMSIEAIIDVVKGYRCRLVELTGGEPLFQENVYDLMTRLNDEGFEVLVETGGSLDISRVDPRVKRIVDFKCPSSKMMKKNLWNNVECLKAGDEVKFVVGNREDYEWARGMIAQYTIVKRCPILMSVVFGELEPIRLAEWILEDKLDVRFQLQLHKYIWRPETKGV
ncbi:MAG: radical SAM protein [Ignavibacteriae bacterium]|nr:radical SAM protein [Ignavibacteria bacterium]MBI3364598.1 radical SAM protein [Ignavibacteriota bacterium]